MPRPRQATFDDIGELLLGELFRRASTKEGAASLPGTHLMTLVQKYLNYQEQRTKAEQEALAQQAKETAPLEMIDRPGLSMEKRIAILEEYIAKLQQDWTAATERLVELQKGVTDDGAEKMSNLP